MGDTSEKEIEMLTILLCAQAAVAIFVAGIWVGEHLATRANDLKGKNKW